MAEIIENQTMRLNRLTTRLLRIAKLDRDEVKPRLEPVSLRGIVRDIVDQFARQMGRRISTGIGSDPAEVMIDAELFGLAFTQLLDNACKYSFPDTAVTVELDMSSAEAQVRVTNEGSPIRTEDEALIFERFYRGADESGPPGAGLGLFVARKIMRAHGGSLELEAHGGSASVNCFRITLPVIPENRLEHAEEVHQSIDY
jgi:signal transduction histidine kinase